MKSASSVRTTFAIFLATLCFQTAFRLNGQALPPVQDGPGGPMYRPGEVLVKFKPNVTEADIQGALGTTNLQVLKRIVTGPMKSRGDNGLAVALTSMPVPQAVRVLNNQPGVEYAQPNWVYTHYQANDPYYLNGSMWGMYGSGTVPQNTHGSGAGAVWATSAGSPDVCVGIVDEGIEFLHPDLAKNVWTNPGDVPGNSLDDEGDGYVDDVHGWNALDDNGNIYDAAYDDHGTHVAGTIGAEGGNGTGVVGVNWTVSMISGKFLGPNGGTTADAVQAIDYMTALKTTKGINIVALNNSWGGGGYDPALLGAITRAAQAQILFVAAAGNGDYWGNAINTDASANYPSCYDTTTGAGYDSVIAVTASRATAQRRAGRITAPARWILAHRVLTSTQRFPTTATARTAAPLWLRRM